MANEPFGRQWKAVDVTISGGDMQDRIYWQRKINSYLRGQPCVTYLGSANEKEFIFIHPDAVND
jgi:hypothetical protein